MMRIVRRRGVLWLMWGLLLFSNFMYARSESFSMVSLGLFGIAILAWTRKGSAWKPLGFRSQQGRREWSRGVRGRSQ